MGIPKKEERLKLNEIIDKTKWKLEIPDMQKNFRIEKFNAQG